MNCLTFPAELSEKAAGVPLRTLAALVLTGVLAGCASGPDFKRPAPPVVDSYTAAPVSEQTVSAPTMLGEAQRFRTGAAVGTKWWQELGSHELDALIGQGLEASPTLAAAQSTLRQAQELREARAGATHFPQVDADLGARRQRLNPATQGQEGDAHDFSLYNAGGVARYQPDLSGGKRRALEALTARAEYRRYELEGARLDLAAAIATTAITQARLAGQLQAVETILGAQDEQLQLTRERVRLGHAASDEVLNLQATVEQTRAEVPRLRQQRQENEHRLAVLAGREPGAGGLPSFTLDTFTLPEELPLVLPSELVRRRPDIQAAEALLHAASAEYGVSVAKMYPQLDLSAGLGSQALSTGALFGSGSAVWSLIGELTQSLFNPGLPAEKRASLAALDAAAANYQSVVLESLRNVADTLRAVENDALTLSALATADGAAQGALQSVQGQYSLGAASYVQLLIAQQQAQQIRIDLIGAQAQRLVDSATLYREMGGAGWR